MTVVVVGPVAVTVTVTGPVIVIVPVIRNLSGLRSIARCMLTFQQLDVYKRSIEFLGLVYAVRERLPKGHGDLADQLRRAAQSITLNIAEGAGRAARADKAKHYTIARGSAMECAAALDVLRLGELIDVEGYGRGIELLERVVSMLTKLINP